MSLGKRLREIRVKARKSGIKLEDEMRWSVEYLGAPAGFYVYGSDDKREEKVGAVHVPQLAYERFRLEVMPPNRFLNKASIMRPWRRIPGNDRASKR